MGRRTQERKRGAVSAPSAESSPSSLTPATFPLAHSRTYAEYGPRAEVDDLGRTVRVLLRRDGEEADDGLVRVSTQLVHLRAELLHEAAPHPAPVLPPPSSFSSRRVSARLLQLAFDNLPRSASFTSQHRRRSSDDCRGHWARKREGAGRELSTLAKHFSSNRCLDEGMRLIFRMKISPPVSAALRPGLGERPLYASARLSSRLSESCMRFQPTPSHLSADESNLSTTSLIPSTECLGFGRVMSRRYGNK